MACTIRVTTLVDDTAGSKGTQAEHGLSFWIETDSLRVLFDTGQGGALWNNARTLRIRLERTDAMVLSHGHYDHTGGLDRVLESAPDARVYAHPAAFEPKYKCDRNGSGSYIGAPAAARDTVLQHAGEWTRTTHPTEIGNGLFVTGPIPRMTEFEDTGGPFFLDRECRQPDLLLDDQAMFFATPQGTVVLVGCAHSGIINTAQYIQQLTENRRIHTIMGGVHLVSASRERLEQTAEALRKTGVAQLALAHCTGQAGKAALEKAFPGKCPLCATGTYAEFTS